MRPITNKSDHISRKPILNPYGQSNAHTPASHRGRRWIFYGTRFCLLVKSSGWTDPLLQPFAITLPRYASVAVNKPRCRNARSAESGPCRSRSRDKNKRSRTSRRARVSETRSFRGDLNNYYWLSSARAADRKCEAVVPKSLIKTDTRTVVDGLARAAPILRKSAPARRVGHENRRTRRGIYT